MHSLVARSSALGCLAAAALVLLPACKGGDDGGGQCAAGLLPGDLVISEIMANPPGADDQQEWLEIYNAGSSAVTLDGVLLAHAKEDGTGEKDHELTSVTIEPGAYLVVGNMIEDVLPPHVDYGYGNDLGDMRNSAGELTLRCGDEIIDRVRYVDPADGASRGFDGSQAPDAVGNDDLAAWCDATVEYADGALGSPGQANEACAGGQSTCVDGEASRDVVAPQVGDLIISEYMPNPAAVGDTEGEWFEVYVAADVDLNGLEIGKTVGTVEDTVAAAECLSFTAGEYVVFARNEDAATNGNLPVVDFDFGFSIGNSSGGLFIGRGGEALDEIAYTGSSDGASTSLHPDRFDVLANDDEGSWCVGADAYGDGDLGTPGAANVECEIPPPPGKCEEDGELRDVVTPSAGDVVINEFMADPSAAADADGEWFELWIANPVDLNGLEIGKTPGDVEDTINPVECLSVPGGSYVVFAKTTDDGLNGGLPQVDHVFSFSLTNTSGALFVGLDGAVLDEISWTSTDGGEATSLDQDAQGDASANDDEQQWCAAVDAYGDGDLGTPGAINPVCGGGGAGNCMDGNVERPIVKPAPGDLVITEFMPDPDAVGDATGEYLELWATQAVDLNGLQLGAVVGDVKGTINSVDCIPIAQDSFALLAAAPDGNGGLPAIDAEFPGSFGLTNTPAEGGVFIAIEDTLLDSVEYGASFKGGAWNLDPDFFDIADNDSVDTNWCEASSTYGDGDNGTPKDTNDQCQ